MVPPPCGGDAVELVTGGGGGGGERVTAEAKAGAGACGGEDLSPMGSELGPETRPGAEPGVAMGGVQGVSESDGGTLGRGSARDGGEGRGPSRRNYNISIRSIRALSSARANSAISRRAPPELALAFAPEQHPGSAGPFPRTDYVINPAALIKITPQCAGDVCGSSLGE